MGAWSQECSQAFPGGLVVRIQHFTWVQPRVREPRSHKPWGVAKKKENKTESSCFKMGGSGTCFSMDGDGGGGGEGMVGDAGFREGGLDIEDLKAGQRLEGARS